MQQPIIYPTEWSRGKVRGELKPYPTYYRVRMSPPNAKQITTYFKFKDNNNNKEITLKKAEEFMYAESVRQGTIRNQIRYLDANTIEVKIDEYVMKTDAKLLDKVELYPLNVNIIKGKSNTRYYVMSQNKKVKTPFTNLICNYDKLQYINGDTFDLRLENLKEFGLITKFHEKIAAADYDIKNQYSYFNTEIDKLPKNIWILGRPMGTTFKRHSENKWTSNVKDKNGIQHTKTFDIREYDSSDSAFIVAKNWRIDTSYKLGMTKNLIKILDNDVILVQLDEGQFTKTDKIFIPLLQEIFLCSATSGNGFIYVIASFNNITMKFHNLITGFKKTDHINSDKLNNCLENLRETNSYLNNKNRHYDNISKLKKNHYVSSIDFNGISYDKQFSVKEYGDEKAKELADNFRKIFYTGKKFESIINTNDDSQFMELELRKMQYIYKLAKNGIVYDYKKYCKNNLIGDILNEDKLNEDDLNKIVPKRTKLTEDNLKKIHYYYLSHQLKYCKWLTDESNRILRLLN
jgi:translation elongation factor P/translation initiation factor 5A